MTRRRVRIVAAFAAGALVAQCRNRVVVEPTENAAWKLDTSAPLAVYEAQGATLNGRLHVFGGFYDAKTRATTQSAAYEPTTNRWTPVAALPEPVTHAGTATDGRYVYLVGGFVGDHPGVTTAHVWRYDSADDSWRALPALPAPRGAGAAAILGYDLHFFGGATRNGDAWVADAGDHWVLSLDTLTTWRPRAPLPIPRNHLGALSLGGKVYAIGGQTLGDEQRGNQATVQTYDPTLDAWRSVQDMPEPRGHIVASVVEWNGRIVVIGGLGQGATQLSDVIAYDVQANAWSVLPSLPAPRQSPVAGNVGNRLVVATGGHNGPRATTWEMIQ